MSVSFLTNKDKEELIKKINESDGGSGSGTGGTGGENGSIWQGKTASFYGDSLTEINWHYTKGYHQWVKEILGLTAYNNYGVSGYKVLDVYNKVNAVNDTADIIFVMIGVNDVQFNVPLGTAESLEAGTVYGNLDSLCAKLREKYPTKLLVFITPHEQTNYPSSIGVSMYDVAKAVKEVCGKYSIVVYDNFVKSEICTTNLSYWTTDNCHWNDKAHEMVGKNLAHFVMDTFRYLPDTSVESEKTLNSITATFNQGNAVIYDTDALTALKQYLTVTAKYTDGTSETVNGYTLSGTLTEGTSIVTVSYFGKTTNFNVLVTKNDTSSGGEDVPVDNSAYIGKTFTMKGYHNGLFNFTAIVGVDSDFVVGNTVTLGVSGNDAQNMESCSAVGAQLFGDNSGECANSAYVDGYSNDMTVASAVSDAGVVTATNNYVISKTPSTKYIKVIAFFKAVDINLPSSFNIEQIYVTVNGKEKKIIAIGGFFDGESSTLGDLEPDDEIIENEYPLSIVNGSVDSAIYSNNTLTLTGLNQTFGGVIFEGAKEISFDIAANNFAVDGKAGWILIRDGNVFHAVGGTNKGETEHYDFDNTLANASEAEIEPILCPASGTISVKIESGSANMYINDTLALSLQGDAIGYAISSYKKSSLYELTIV